MISVTHRARQPWSMFDDLLSWQDDFNRLLDGSRLNRRGAGYPPVNAWISDDHVVVEAELPGVDPKDVDISVEGDELKLSGKREPEPELESRRYHKRERTSGEFSRVLSLPYRVDSGKVQAAYRHGLLRVSLPRAEADKPKKITVEAG